MQGLLLLALIAVSIGGTAWPLFLAHRWTQRRWPSKQGNALWVVLRMIPFAVLFLFAEPVLTGTLIGLSERLGLLQRKRQWPALRQAVLQVIEG